MTGQCQAFQRAFIVAATLAVCGCATPPANPQARAAYDEANDPLEPTNRRIFEFNRVLDGLLIKNIAILYTTVVPEGVRTSLRNALINLNEPVVFANNLLQARLGRAGTTAARFTINSTVGLAGLFDVATDWGYPEQTGDFGQTLYSWGTPDGPYLVIPVLGPTNPRDGIGEGIDGHFDPFRILAKDQGWTGMSESRFAAAGLDERAQALPKLDEIEKTSIDYYAEIRSLYRQNRAQQLQGKVTSPTLNEGFYQDPAKPGAQP